jgi:hypothetical protein
MKKFKVKTVILERSYHIQELEAESAEDAEAKVLEQIQENGYPETDDFETADLDIKAEEVQ